MKLEIKDSAQFSYMWRNNGLNLEDAKRYNITDALSVPDAQFFLPQVVENIVREAVEPLMVGSSLLQKINYKYGQTISFPSIGSLTAADIPEGEEYPERKLQVGPGTVIATIGKSGIAVKITEEMMRYSQFDVINLHLHHAGRALARHKEQKIWNMFLQTGVTTHDNANPTQSVYGTTTGRDLAGASNGSVTMDDIFEAYGSVLTQGFTADTLVMHPLTWVMFVRDPVMRAFALNSGGGTMFQGWQGNPAAQNPWASGAQGGLGPASQQRIDPKTAALEAYPQTLNSAPQLPSYLGVPLKIVVSPFVPYNPVTKVTDMFLIDSSNAGALIVDEEPTMDEVQDKLRDITKIKVRERYALAPLNEGNGVAVLKNVKVVPNEIVLPQQSTISGLAAVDRTSAV